MTEAHVPEKSTRSAQVEANRRNAKRSTGPTTAEGKARSSQNAVTHGVFSTSGRHIGSGLFAEAPDAVEAFLDGIVTGFAPRDPLEDAQAQIVARVYLREFRLGRFETAALGTAGTAAVSEQRRDADEIHQAKETWEGLEDLRLALTGEENDPDCEKLAKFIRQRQTGAAAAAARLWRDQLPDTPEDWREAFTVLLEEVWGPGHPGALEWTQDEQIASRHALGVAEGRALAVASDRALQTLDRVTVYSTRISLVLERALRDYRQLRARPLTSPSEPPAPAPKAPIRTVSLAEINARGTNPTLENPPAT